MTKTDSSDPLARGVDDVLITGELESRPSRTPDHESESRALGLLAREMASNAPAMLEKCAELVMELCRADSAGISILEPGGTSGMFRWYAAVGGFAPNLHGTMPREASPCGTTIDRNCVLLFNEAERIFPAMRGVEPRIYENLLAPWHVRGEPVGTLWAIKHSPEGRFDAEDARLLQSLARFAAAAFQMTSALEEATSVGIALEESNARSMLLLRELQHRVRNTLGMIRSMIGQSRKSHTDLEEFCGHFVGRLDAMARTQAILTRAPGRKVDLEGLIRVELGAQSTSENAFEVEGPGVQLSPRAAEVVALAIHELATNSIKYGALTDPAGKLRISWYLEPGQDADWLHLAWTESSSVIASRGKRGLGTELIEARVPYELHGKGSLDILPGEVRAAIAFPLVEGSSILETGHIRGALG